MGKPRPRIVCLCGSTRFWKEFQEASLRETLAGKIVLSIGAASGTDAEHFGGLPEEEYAKVKARLDELHLRKIDLADEVLVLNVGGYVGKSTGDEIRYAVQHHKPVRFLKPGWEPKWFYDFVSGLTGEVVDARGKIFTCGVVYSCAELIRKGEERHAEFLWDVSGFDEGDLALCDEYDAREVRKCLKRWARRKEAR